MALRLKYIRCYLFGMKNLSFAKHTGFDPSSIHNWENGKYRPLKKSIQKLPKICGPNLLKYAVAIVLNHRVH
ncbi:MAG: helix-turn-helix transcriptional regulator [Desulfobacula sp.]|uniref:helix-turn-helix domain-containing protein n=1 Tax=Desulfobacula sp. TaxID=2593537 RepID=UPI001D531F2E|nr:helix-turn-helix transcriptional regulator [Desulfobacula sp.]MBT3805921.1 helix-turn-helix transcriptional regulator [Desulfobacula sp.]MBT4024376.1 helix-turn-helix transcriptional regulator [Desulfobacula sp.]MBT5546016.1 helix-turn-helix transcriptional regulator [Desulfobacula sp.]MBT5972552.1 helix-turn-helix transcriptional regulator [Desulfobacula sp.]